MARPTSAAALALVRAMYEALHIAEGARSPPMTRILACSDIHNNIAAVRKLRSREGNDYDAVIVAGDIGSKAAHEIFAVLRTLGCPVLFVLGNWDHGLGHRDDFGTGCHHLHLSPFRLGDLSIVGESVDGIDPTWEAMRAEIEATRPERLSVTREEYFERQQALLPKIVANEALDLTVVVVTHYRLTKTRDYLPGVPLFLFGHNHGFKDTTFLGSRFVNVSALDSKVMVVREDLTRVRHNDYRFINDGSYVVITYEQRHGFSVEQRRFDPDFSGWRRFEKEFNSWAIEVE